MIKVLLADDSEPMRKAIAGLLKDDTEIELMAETGNVNYAIQIANQLRPDVVVMDLHMITEKDPPTQVSSCLAGSRLILISFGVERGAETIATNLGAVALLDKMRLAIELIPTIKKNRPATDSHSFTA